MIQVSQRVGQFETLTDSDLQAEMFYLDDVSEMVEHVHRKAMAANKNSRAKRAVSPDPSRRPSSASRCRMFGRWGSQRIETKR